jgi:hypothetical protein
VPLAGVYANGTLVVLHLAHKTHDRQRRIAGLGDKNAARRILECPEPQQPLRDGQVISH